MAKVLGDCNLEEKNTYIVNIKHFIIRQDKDSVVGEQRRRMLMMTI